MVHAAKSPLIPASLMRDRPPPSRLSVSRFEPMLSAIDWSARFEMRVQKLRCRCAMCIE